MGMPVKTTYRILDNKVLPDEINEFHDNKKTKIRFRKTKGKGSGGFPMNRKPRFVSDGLPIFGKVEPRFINSAVRVGFRSIETSKIRKLDSQVTSEEWKKPSFISSKFAEEWENSKIQSGGFPKKGKSRNQDSIWQASEKQKTKKPRFVISGRLLKNENPKIRSGGFLKNENLKIKIRGLLKNENPKIRSAGFCVEKPRFVRWASDLWEKGTKIHKYDN
ncbi:hypothetical protein RhiirB3_441722 [Rhizophagus irregularis]|nr:hypothetical protein RhiirB3_441722 [Rhizophagus irregularis]